jgi:hypothetical protein
MSGCLVMQFPSGLTVETDSAFRLLANVIRVEQSLAEQIRQSPCMVVIIRMLHPTVLRHGWRMSEVDTVVRLHEARRLPNPSDKWIPWLAGMA